MAPSRWLAWVCGIAALAAACGGKTVVDGGGNGGSGAGGTTTTSTHSTTSTTSTSSGTGGGYACNPGAVQCNSPAPFCDPGEVPSVENACWGPCVPILLCATEASCNDCQSGFCAAYLSWTTEYRCVAPSLQCQALACSCLAPYFCVAPYDACSTSGGGAPVVTCDCPTC